MTRSALTLVLVVALLASTVAVVPVSAADSPNAEIYVPDRTLEPGKTQKLTLQVVNEREDPDQEVRPAQAVSVNVKSGDTPIGVKSGRQYLGPLAEGQLKTASVQVTVPSDIDAGTHKLPVTVRFNDKGDTLHVDRTAKVRIESQPRFKILNSSTTAPIGGKGAVSVTMKNVGDEKASESVVSLTSSSGDVTFGKSNSAKRFVGTWKTGEVRTVSYDASVAADGDPRNYTMQATVNYQDTDGIAGTSRALSFGVKPLPEQTFAVDNVSSTLNVGQRGTLSGTVTNTGTLAVNNAVVVFKSDDPAIRPVGSEYAIGTLEPNESRDFAFDVRVNGSTDAGPRQLAVQVRYRNADDDQLQGEPIDVRADIEPQRPEFEIRNVESSLRVGSEGTLRGDVVNTGDAPVTNTVVVFQTSSQTVTPVENEYALGDLQPGENASFAFDTDISGSADAGPRQFSFRVRYRNADNVQQRSGSLDVQTSVGEETPEFEVERINSSVSAGGSDELRLRVTNARDEELSDISAKLYTESPLSTSDDQAYVESLAPGESEEIVFAISAGGDALEKPYPVKLDFKYDDTEGETTVSDTYQVPVSVTKSEGGGPSLPLVGVVALLAIGAGLVFYRRR
jgi:hypothetical protein